MIRSDAYVKELVENKTKGADLRTIRDITDVFMAVYYNLSNKGLINLDYSHKEDCAKAISSLFTVSKLQDTIKEKLNRDTRYDKNPASYVKWGRVIDEIEECFDISLNKERIGVYTKPDVICSCGTVCVFSLEQRGRRKGEYVWLCPSCHASVGVHKGTDIPLGSPVKHDVGVLRADVHKEINRLSDSGLAVNKIYQILSREMNLPSEKTHVGLFDKEQCNEALKILKPMNGGYRL